MTALRRRSQAPARGPHLALLAVAAVAAASDAAADSANGAAGPADAGSETCAAAGGPGCAAAAPVENNASAVGAAASEERALSVLEQVRQKQKEVHERIKKNALDMKSIWEMCDLKMREAFIAGIGSKASYYKLKVTDCLQTFVSALQMLQMLARTQSKAEPKEAAGEGEAEAKDLAEEEEDEDDNYEEIPFWRFFQYATVSSQRLLMFSEGSPRRFESGSKFLVEVLKNKTWCNDEERQHRLLAHTVRGAPQSCSSAYADLLLNMWLAACDSPRSCPPTGSGQVRDIEKQWEASQKLPHPFEWATAKRLHIQLPGIRAKPHWLCEDLPAETCSWVRELEAAASDIDAELTAYLNSKNGGDPEESGINNGGHLNEHIAWRIPRSAPEAKCCAEEEKNVQKEAGQPAAPKLLWPRWASAPLQIRGKWDEELCGAEGQRDAPFAKTCGLLRGRPELDVRNYAYHWQGSGDHLLENVSEPVLMVHLYRVDPGTWLRPHFGTHGRILISLGLSGVEGVPGSDADCCFPTMRVGGEERRWRKGEALIFDDAFVHDVTVPPRAPPRHVLTVAIVHPDLMRKPA